MEENTGVSLALESMYVLGEGLKKIDGTYGVVQYGYIYIYIYIYICKVKVMRKGIYLGHF